MKHLGTTRLESFQKAYYLILNAGQFFLHPCNE